MIDALSGVKGRVLEDLMKRCLIADQSEVIRKIARHYLESLSCETLEANSADEALDLLRQQTVTAVLLDWRLPGKTTIEFLSALRFSGIEYRPLVIYVTTENDPLDIRKAFAAGADTYLIKPFDRASFVETMRNAGLATGTAAVQAASSHALPGHMAHGPYDSAMRPT